MGSPRRPLWRSSHSRDPRALEHRLRSSVGQCGGTGAGRQDHLGTPSAAGRLPPTQHSSPQSHRKTPGNHRADETITGENPTDPRASPSHPGNCCSWGPLRPRMSGWLCWRPHLGRVGVPRLLFRDLTWACRCVWWVAWRDLHPRVPSVPFAALTLGERPLGSAGTWVFFLPPACLFSSCSDPGIQSPFL